MGTKSFTLRSLLLFFFPLLLLLLLKYVNFDNTVHEISKVILDNEKSIN